MHKFLMNEAGGEGSAGSGSSTLLGSTPTPAPMSTPAPDAFTAPEWLKGIDESLVRDPSLATIHDLPNLVKSYVNGQKLIGRDKLILPNEYDGPEAWNPIFEKLGVPKDAKEYQFKEKFEYDEPYLNDFKAFAKENGLLPRQAEAMLKRLQNEDAAMSQAEEAQSAKFREESLASLNKEYGQALPAKLNLARNALNSVADEGMLKYVEESGLSDDPQFIKFLTKIGEKFFTEDKINSPAGQPGAFSPSEAQNKINEVMGNPKHAYWDGNHPAHAQAVADLNKLYGYIG